MIDEIHSAAAPRWRGEAGRMEVWYATLSDPATHAGLWVHYEIVAPTTGEAPFGHGWVTFFPADNSPCTERFGPAPVQPSSDQWFSAAGVEATLDGFTGRARTFAWDLRWKDTTPHPGHAAAASSSVTTCTTRAPSSQRSTRSTRTPGSPNNNVVPSDTALGFLPPSESVATFRLRKAKGLPMQRHAL